MQKINLKDVLVCLMYYVCLYISLKYDYIELDIALAVVDYCYANHIRIL